VSFVRTKFDSCSGTYATWLHSARTRFRECTFIGSNLMAQRNPILDPKDAPVFEDCFFTDNPAWSRDGVLPGVNSMLEAGGGALAPRTTFKRCIFEVAYGPFNPFLCNGTGADMAGVVGNPGPDGSWFEDCSFHVNNYYVTHALADVKLTGFNFGGLTKITTDGTARLDLLNSVGCGIIAGHILLNGVHQRAASAAFDPPNIAAGGRTTTTINVPRARVGRDAVRVMFSQNLQGIKLSGYVSTDCTEVATGVVTVAFENPTGGAINLAAGTLTVMLEDMLK
jgi:hypothetical protein